MSYRSYCLDLLRNNGHIITWYEKGRRQYAWRHNGQFYVCSRDESPRRMGRTRLDWVFRNRYVEVKHPSEVPDPVAVLVRYGPEVAASTT